MFKPNRLTYKKEPNNYDELFRKTERGEISTEKAVDQFATMEENRRIEEVKEKLKSQFSTTLPRNQRILDPEKAKSALQELESEDPEVRKKILRDIYQREENVKLYIKELELGENLILDDQTQVNVFTKDKNRGIDSEQQYLDEFRQLSPEDQIKWLREIKSDIKDRTTQFNEFVQFVHDPKIRDKEIEKFKTLRRSERTSYLKEIKEIDEKFKDLINKSTASEDQKEKELEMFEDRGLADKKIALEKLRKSQLVHQKDEEFMQANEKRREKTEERRHFHFEDSETKEKILRGIREEIAKEYLDALKENEYLCKKDIEVMSPTVSGRFSIELAEISLKDLVNPSKSELSKITTLAKEITEKFEKVDKKILEHFKWDTLTTWDKKPFLKNGLIEKYTEEMEHIELDKEYEKKLSEYQKYEPYGLITKEAHERYYKQFQAYDIDKKKEVLKKGQELDKTIDVRKKIIERFEQLPAQINKEYREKFKNSGFEERLEMVMDTEARNEQSEVEFKTKLEEMVEEHLLSPESQKRYMNEFKNDLNLSERDHYMKHCNLDKPERKEILKTFEKIILKFAPEDEHDELKEEFYSANLNLRRKKIITWINKYVPDAMGPLKKRLDGLKNSKTDKPLDAFEAEYKSMLKMAEKHEENGDSKKALHFYEEILELDYELKSKEREQIEEKIKKLTKQSSYYDKLQEGHFKEILDDKIEEIISKDVGLQEEQENITIMKVVGKILRRNEIFFANPKTTQEQMDSTLDDEDDEDAAEFNQLFMEWNQGKSSLYYDQHDRLKHGTVKSLDVNEFDTLGHKKYWMNEVSHYQRLPQAQYFDSALEAVDPKKNRRFTAKEFNIEQVIPRTQEFVDILIPKALEELGLREDKVSGTTLKAMNHHMLEMDWEIRLPETLKKQVED